jgi:hypothetical protein
MAAVLSCGPTAVLSHLSALALYGLRYPPPHIHVTVPGKRRANRDKPRLHSDTLEPHEITIVEAIPTTTVARARLGASPDLDDAQLTKTVEQADRMHLFNINDVRIALAAHPGAPGTAKLKAIVATYTLPAPTRSELEREFRELIDRPGIPPPLINSLVEGFEVDFCWPRAKLIVELARAA